MTSQSGGGGGYAGVTSNGQNGLVIGGNLDVGDPSNPFQPNLLRVFGSDLFADVDVMAVNGNHLVSFLQSIDLPLGGGESYALVVTRSGSTVLADYSSPAVGINDDSASAQPALSVTKQGTTVLELTTRKSITGALASVTDANAKAVLTSIIATLTGVKLATDNTT